MRLRQYEGMFLFDPTFAVDFAKAEAEIKRILDRAKAELVFCRKWDERRLAYEIQGRRRGTYVLTYFMCQADGISGIERDVRLSEHVLRVLVLKADHMDRDRMAEFAPERRVEAPPPDDDDDDEPVERKSPPAKAVADATDDDAEDQPKVVAEESGEDAAVVAAPADDGETAEP